MQGSLVFRQTPLGDVAAALHRRFDVAFEIADSALAGQTIDARFERESLGEMLEVISFASGAQYELIAEAGRVRRVRWFLASAP